MILTNRLSWSSSRIEHFIHFASCNCEHLIKGLLQTLNVHYFFDFIFVKIRGQVDLCVVIRGSVSAESPCSGSLLVLFPRYFPSGREIYNKQDWSLDLPSTPHLLSPGEECPGGRSPPDSLRSPPSLRTQPSLLRPREQQAGGWKPWEQFASYWFTLEH